MTKQTDAEQNHANGEHNQFVLRVCVLRDTSFRAQSEAERLPNRFREITTDKPQKQLVHPSLVGEVLELCNRPGIPKKASDSGQNMAHEDKDPL
jgi:hypothetical protein